MVLETKEDLLVAICTNQHAHGLSAPAMDLITEEIEKQLGILGKPISPWLINNIVRCCHEFDTPAEAVEFYRFYSFPEEGEMTWEKLVELFIVYHLDPDDHPETDPVLVIEPQAFCE